MCFARYASALSVLTLALGFAVVVPTILPWAALYFSIKLYVADIRDQQEAYEAWDSWFGQLGIDPDKRPVRNILQAVVKDRMLRVELYAHAALPAAGEEPLPGGVPVTRRAHR